MPFGLSTAPDEFQRRQHQVVEDLSGVKSIHDDILVFGEGETIKEAIEDHDARLQALLGRCRARIGKLNAEKIKLRMTSVPFLGHMITEQGLKPDPEKVRAVVDMPNLVDVAGVQRFLRFVNYLSKFLPKLTDVCEPLWKLTVKDTEWCWFEIHEKAVEEIKKLVTSAPILGY